MELAEGLPDLPEFGTLITTSADFDRWRWYGDGPEECYVDRRAGARLGVYESGRPRPRSRRTCVRRRRAAAPACAGPR